MNSEQLALYNMLDYHSQNIKKYSDKYSNIQNKNKYSFKLDYYGRLLFQELFEYSQLYKEAEKQIPNKITNFPKIMFYRNGKKSTVYTNKFYVIR